jgi:hypothetical protein
MATKADGTARIERVWNEVDARFAALDATDLDRPVFTGEGAGWRVRDFMPHFAFWLRLSARGARKAAEIGKTPDENTPLRKFLGIDTPFDALNAQTFASWRADTDGIRRYIWQPAVNHPREHREHIDAALAKEGAS